MEITKCLVFCLIPLTLIDWPCTMFKCSTSPPDLPNTLIGNVFVLAVKGSSNDNIIHPTMPLALIERDYHFELGLLLKPSNMWHQHRKTCDAFPKTAVNLDQQLWMSKLGMILALVLECQIFLTFYCPTNLHWSLPILIPTTKVFPYEHFTLAADWTFSNRPWQTSAARRVCCTVTCDWPSNPPR